MPTNHPRTLHNIQMLRAFAAMLVLLHHALPHYEVMGGSISIIKTVAHWGFTGVDIFFVISGFIMAYTTFPKERTADNAKTFIKHRLFRIYLGYWPFFLAMLLIWYKKNPDKLHSFDLVGSFFLTNTDMYQLVLPISWSLTYELYFYVLFLLTFLFQIKQLYKIIPAFTLLIILLGIYTFMTHSEPAPFIYSPFLIEFFAGVLLYMYRQYLLTYTMLPVALFIMIISYSLGITHETFNGLSRVLCFGGGAFALVWSVMILEQYAIYRAGHFLVTLGNASYTLYLSHLIILELFYYAGLRNLFTSSEHPFVPLTGLLVLLVLCITFSLLYYRKIEKPLYKTAISYGSRP